MNDTNTGGPAFPEIAYKAPAGGGSHIMTVYGGMTLRDYFAAKAMQSILIDPRIDNDSYRECAEGAYKAADAMLKAREA
jgi:hypothetical protein